ncbi:acyl-CoA dehydrogenase family protein [Amycolatopsis anabasis]|uniref:acyl-CoA dehydrogenase family protein n=1 Tax=Amycolatopsis anabasis TaxID=1840409 RepID=UPI00131B4BE1|nr:acyl-CoA dehydrogenase family protein [Amycolatopsis anabasis]
MIELDDRLSALRARARAWSEDLRAIALDLDRDPATIERVLDLPAIEHIGLFQYPPRFQPGPLVLGGHRFHGDSAVEHVVFFEELARGDVGAMMAAPGAPMAGPLVALLGDEAQQESFFGRLRARPTWTFLALTEPATGSDPAAMETRLRPDGDRFLLTGAKRYVGNATRAGPGVVFARTGPGPLGLCAVLVEGGDPGFTATPLPTLGLRGAVLSAISLDSVELGPERLLGRHLSPARRGTWSWVRIFNRLRPAVAAMGLGIARAAHEYIGDHRRALSAAERTRFDELARRIDAVRQLTLHAAVAVDANPADGHLASAAKVRSAALAEEVTRAALDFFGAGARFDHPLLDKLARDARGVEFMEGAGNVQKLGVYHHLARGRTHHG